MKQNIEYGDWVYLKSAPEIKVKVTIINPNRIIDFRSQRSEPPYFAHEEDMVKITDENIIMELEVNLPDFIQE